MVGKVSFWVGLGIALVLVVSGGCGERERLTGPAGSGELGEETIDAVGGVLVAEGFRLIVPPGAFQSATTLRLRDASAGAPADEHRITPVYEVVGIPETIALPCSLQLAVAETEGDGFPVIILEEPDTFIPSKGDFGRAPVTLDCVRAAGAVRALLPATPDDDKRWLEKDNASGTFRFSARENLIAHNTSEGHFQILFYRIQEQQIAQQIGADLESAYRMLRDDVGLSWGKRTRPIKVTLGPFAEEDKEAWGLHCPSKWYGADYDEILLNSSKINANPGSVELKGTLGHELFHLMQHLYDPRSRILQGSPNEWFWMNEAMSTWFERKMIDAGYIPEHIRETDFRLLLDHALQFTPNYTLGVSCDDCWVVQNHGYGASLFLGTMFEGFTGGEAKIGDVLELRLQDENHLPISALREVFSSYTVGLDAEWPLYCQRWMDGSIYPAVPRFPSPDKIVEARNETFTFAVPEQSDHTFYWQGSDYGAHLFMLYFNAAAQIPDNAAATISFMDEEGGSQVLIYEYKKDAIWSRFGGIDQSGRGISVPDVGLRARDGKALAILVLRSHGAQAGVVPVAVSVRIERCQPGAAVVLNGVTIPESRITRTPAGCARKIDLREMSLTDPDCLDGIDAVGGALEELILYGNRMTTVDLGDLEHCSELRVLDLRYMGLQSVDLSPLETCKKFEDLDVTGNQLPSLDLSPLGSCKKLRSLRARDNFIQGLDLTPVGSVDSLRTLVLSMNYLDGISLAPLAGALKLETLEMNACDLVQIDLSPLATCSRLNFLALGENRLGALDIAPLSGHANLEFLSCNGNVLTQINLAPMTSCPALRSVNLVNNMLSSVNLAPLDGLTNLRWLELEQNPLDETTCGSVCAFKGSHPGCSVTSDCGCKR
jgi:hypothetical protein